MRTTRCHAQVLVSGIILTLTLAACGGDGGDAAVGGADADVADAVDPGQAAAIAGTVRFDGVAPAPEPIDMSDEPTCAAKHTGTGALRNRVAVNAEGSLRNVFVHVRDGLGDRRFPASRDPVVIDQDGCVYHPHVSGVMTGQEVTFRNSDGLLHNINARPEANRPFNISQPQNMDSRRTFAQPEIMIPIRCDVHGWMEAYVGVVNHPYFAVTGEDGTFRIENLPPGTYTLEAWHEQLGTQTMQVTVGPQETGSADFTFRPGTAARVPLGAPVDPHDHGPVASAHH